MSIPEINSFASEQIEQIRRKCSTIQPLVVARCIAYNHEQYIEETLKGFVMQKTDFPFVVLIHDDASTDKTAEIIRSYAEKYPDLILPIFEKKNVYSLRNGTFGKIIRAAQAATGAKYIALCEGDDYWTDPLKLQKQVDFLEAHPDYSMVYGKDQEFIQTKQRFGKIWGGSNTSLLELLKENTIPTLTVVYRTSCLQDYLNFTASHKSGWKMGDYPLWVFLAYIGKIKFIPDVFGVYRIVPDSASHSTSLTRQLAFRLSYFDIKIWFANHTGIAEQHKALVAQWEFARCELALRIANIDKDRAKINNTVLELKALIKEYNNYVTRRFRLLSRLPRLGIKLLDFIERFRKQ